MKARNFKQANVTFAKDQKQYQPLPAFLDDGAVTMSFKLSEDEIQQVVETGTIWLTTITFNKPLQPVGPDLLKPFDDYTPEKWVNIEGVNYEARQDINNILGKCFKFKPDTISDRIDIISEFDRIQRKVSKLSANNREWVESTFNKAFKKV